MESVGTAARPLHVAIIGGGITGAVCARELLKLSAGRLLVTVFDQGRGLGGRTSHRRVREDGENILPTNESAAYKFDHGCQFFRADSKQFRSEVLPEWLEKGWAAQWEGEFGQLGSGTDAPASEADFFGFPRQPPFYCGVGGMSALPCALCKDAADTHGAVLRGGVRVASTLLLSSGRWLLRGVEGQAAFHDTAEEEAARAAPDSLGEFDAVVVTDVSAAAQGWHRASAGIPRHLAEQVVGRARVVLFTCLVAFETPLPVTQAAFSASDDTLWFASRTSSKPGMHGPSGGADVPADCWTLVSTPKFAAAEVARVPMQDPVTGAFRPQEMDYLREGPCKLLIEAFHRCLMASGAAKGTPSLPKVAYVGGQRWGSSFPAPVNVGGRDAAGKSAETTVEVMGVAYETSATLPLVPLPEDGTGRGGKGEGRGADFLADDSQRIYYASDYVSTRSPGMEAAALSGLDTARYVVRTLLAEPTSPAEECAVLEGCTHGLHA